MISKMQSLWNIIGGANDKKRVYRVAFVSGYDSSTMRHYAEQVAGYGQLFTAGRIEPSYFHNLAQRNGLAEFIARLHTGSFDAIVSFGNVASRILFNDVATDPALCVPTIVLADKGLLDGNLPSHARAMLIAQDSDRYFNVIYRLRSQISTVIVCASERYLQNSLTARGLVESLSANEFNVIQLAVDGKTPFRQRFESLGDSLDLMFLASDALVTYHMPELIALARAHKVISFSAMLSSLADGVDCALGHVEAALF